MFYFDSSFQAFYSELAENNNREWWQANKPRFETVAMAPLKRLVQDATRQINLFDNTLQQDPKQIIYRPNRDIRFSANKKPYKENISALLNPEGKKFSIGNLYFQMSATEFMLAGGLYQPEKDQLRMVRQCIANQPDALNDLLANKDFKKVWGTLQGEKNKIMPSEFKEDALTIPALYHKQFLYEKTYPVEVIYEDGLDKLLAMHYKAGLPLANYLREALTLGNEGN